SRRNTPYPDASQALDLGLKHLGRLRRDFIQFFTMLAVFPASFDLAAVADVWALKAPLAHDVMDVLLARNMVIREGDRFRLHDLMRGAAQRAIGIKELTEAGRRHAQHYCKVLAKAEEFFTQGKAGMRQGLSLFDQEWGNINAGQAWAVKHWEEDRVLTRVVSDYFDLSPSILDLRQSPRIRVQWGEVALAAANRLGYRKTQSRHLCNTALAYTGLNDISRAIEYCKQALALARESNARREEGQSLSILGKVCAIQGRTRRAISYFRQHLEITRETGDRRGEGKALGDLGNANATLGEAREALTQYQQSLAIACEIDDLCGEGEAHRNLGSAYVELGEIENAIESYEASLAVAREMEDLRREALSLYGLAKALKYGHNESLDHKMALSHLQEAIAIFEMIEDSAAQSCRLLYEEWRREPTMG
ncbi:MAG: tetratricopeptide repeat protein, partial [Rhodospirillales bacterium]|nr:tetratricopeptide repeat protein [Rhodospirillales bacterium]